MQPEEGAVIEKSTEEAAPKSAVQFRISKKVLWIGLVILVVAVLGLVTWKLRWVQKTVAWYNRGTIALKVKEGDTYALEKATIQIAGATYTTDASGKVQINRITAGSYTVHVTKDGYTPVDKSVKVKRGENDLVIISMDKVPDKLYTIHGFIKDYVSDQSVVDVQVTLGDTNKHSNPAGEFSFDGLKAGDYKLILSKAGYLSKDMTISIKDTDPDTAKVVLVPSGQVLFTSNRSGQRALYVSDFDGSNRHLFVNPQNSGEDFGPSFSPDNKWVAFYSTRDQIKNSYGSTLGRLYIASRDGKTLAKASDDYDQWGVLWSPNGRYIFFNGYTDNSESKSVQRFYDTQKNSTFDLGDSGSNIVFSPDGTQVLYTVSNYGETSPGVYTNYLKLLTIASGERRTLIKKDGNSFTDLGFSTNGKKVYYDVVDQNARKRFEVDVVSAAEQTVSLPTESTRTYILSPDGNTKAFIENRDGKTDLFIVDAQGNNEKRLTTLGTLTSVMNPTWDDTGRYVTFAVQREGENALYVVALAGGDAKKVTDFTFSQATPNYY